MPYHRILTVQDISCVGQCSMTVALPIISACGHECCVLPSAVLSTHTGGFGAPAIQNLTGGMEAIRSHWERQKVDFDYIYIGYLGSVAAIEAVEKILDTLLAPNGQIIMDPAMADHGKLYSGLDEVYARAMGRLCDRADVMIPNLTEAAMMTGLPFRDDPDREYVEQLLNCLGGKTVVLTGVGFEEGQTGFAIRSQGCIHYYHHSKIGKNYHGTGDIFASCFTGALAGGKTPVDAARIAADFTFRCIENTYRDPAHWYGVKFETALPDLMKMLG